LTQLTQLTYLTLLSLLLTACRTTSPNPPLQRFTYSSPHMGTLFHISLYATNSTSGQSAAQAAFRRIADLDNIMSDSQPDSDLMRLCDQPFGKPVPISADLFAVMDEAQRFSDLSHGAFDITIGLCVRLWRFARKRKVLPTPAELATARDA